MTREEAARVLGVAVNEVSGVRQTEHGTVALMSTGGERLITPSDGVFAFDDHPGGKHLRRWQDPEEPERDDATPDASALPDPAQREVLTAPPAPAVPSLANPEPDDVHDEVPDGTVDDVLGWVGDDPDRARAALEAEEARDKPRSTLVARLREKAGSTP
ncbi:hypothetical protein [Nonomuraea sp. NPDC050202]|uniref:hypothetical protein n=1 Tax=Nonomuraea sp. NPDC050202 TaxID=3155035 RepID=UPI0033EF3F8F